MRILSLANIADTTDIALLEDARCLRHASAHLGQRFSEEFWQFLSTVLAEIGWALDEIDLFACVRGPASFTGLRVTLAAMNGLAFALERPVFGFTLSEIDIERLQSIPSPAERAAILAHEAYCKAPKPLIFKPVFPEYTAPFFVGKKTALPSH